jgi:hypothetical protein
VSTGSSSDPSATLAALAGEAELADRVRFVVELDRLKQVLRRTVVTDGRRRENTAVNHASAGQAWREHDITAGQVRAMNSTIGDGSAALWELAQHVIDDAVTRGWLPETGR